MHASPKNLQLWPLGGRALSALHLYWQALDNQQVWILFIYPRVYSGCWTLLTNLYADVAVLEARLFTVECKTCRVVRKADSDSSQAGTFVSASSKFSQPQQGLLASLGAPIISALGALGLFSSGLASQTGLGAAPSLMAASSAEDGEIGL